MRFRQEGPDIPDALIALQEKGDAIFICGAGVSRMVGLPSFRGLVEAVYQDLGEDWSQHPAENEVMRERGILANQYDRMLRSLERRLAASDVPGRRGMRERIRAAVRRALLPPEQADLSGHLALLGLSRDAEGQSRLITTNFDTLFERAWRTRTGEEIPSFAHSAMPQPKSARFEGVLHLHGRLIDKALKNLSETDLVLTSAEFGDAYLRSGWASRYVYDVVRSHTVVLVGYEAEDPPMRYLLEALESDRERYSDLHQVYAFAPSEPGSELSVTALWKAKGVEPIVYSPREGAHSPLYVTLREWSQYQEDPTAWRREQLQRFMLALPREQTPEDLTRCISLLSHGDASALLADISPPPEWISELTERRVLGANKARPGQWIARRLNEPDMIRACSKLPMLDDQSIWHIEREIETRGNNLSPIRRKAWQLILRANRAGPPRDTRPSWFIARRYIRQGEAGHDTRQIVRQMVQPRLKISRPYKDESDEADESLAQLLRVDFEPTEGANIGVILEVWPENLGQEVPLFRVLERALIETLEEAQDVGYLDGRDRPCLDVPSVADHNQNKYRRGFYPITRLIADLWCRIALRDRDKALSLVSDLERSPYLLLRRIFLFAARDETTFTAGKAWEALRVLEDEIFWGHDAQVEIMRLATGRWKEFTAAERDAFEARIRRGPPRKLYGPDTFQDDEHWNSVTDSATYKRLTRLQESGGPISSDSQAALDEIAIRHPTWMPGGGDRDDFGVWHESGWGPRGRPEDLAEVADDALVSEAMRLQRERRLDQGDVWHTLCHADPERAHRGLKSEARSHHWEAAAWRGLLWAAVNKGDPALQFELAESLLDMPEAVLAEVVHPAASWLQIRRDTLKGDPAGEKSFLCVWDRLAGLTYLRDGARVQEATNDVLDTALNHPAGLLAYTLLDHGAEKKRPQNSGYPAELSARLTRAASATGMPGVFARALLMRSLAYIESIDHQWAETYLMPSLALDQPCAVQMWRSFAGGGRLGSARLFNALKDIMLDVFAQPAVTDRDLEGLITQLLNIAIHHRRGEQAEYLLSAAEIKRALSVGPLGLREPAAWYLKQLMSGGAPNEKGVRWRQVVGPIFQEIWPLDARFRSEQISEHLLSVCLECGDAFDDAVNAVMDFVVPFRVFLLEDSFRLEEHHSDVVRGHPKSTLRLANAILDPVLYPVPNDLTEFLRFCLDGDPSVQSEASYKRLYGLRRQQGA